MDEVAEILDETSQELRFSRQLLAATMENVTQGISVVDADMNLVAWNHRYLEMFDYPADMCTSAAGCRFDPLECAARRVWSR